MKQPWKLVEAKKGRVIIESVEFADTFWKRLAGLQFRKKMEWSSGLLLVPCPAGIHTFCMYLTIDVISLDRTGKVLSVVPAVKPWRIVPPVRGTHAVLEVPAGVGLVRPGNRLVLQPAAGWEGSPPALPKRLRFLSGD